MVNTYEDADVCSAHAGLTNLDTVFLKLGGRWGGMGRGSGGDGVRGEGTGRRGREDGGRRSARH